METKKKKTGCLKIALIVLGVLIALGIVGAALGAPEESGGSPAASTAASVSAPGSAAEPAPEPASETDAPEAVPTEYLSALKKAESYSEHMHMSKAAIYDQLTSKYGEQFTEQAAQYAMENLQADWNANALACAASYSENMHLSKAAIYDQLTSEYGEQFTAEEAQYAIDHLA